MMARRSWPLSTVTRSKTRSYLFKKPDMPEHRHVGLFVVCLLSGVGRARGQAGRRWHFGAETLESLAVVAISSQ